MIGNNSCGTHSLLAGKTVDNIETLRIVLYDGTQLTVGGRATRSSRRSFARAGDGATFTRRLQIDSRPVRDADPGALSGHSAARIRLQPRSAAAGKRVQRGGRARRQRRHLRCRARGEGQAHRQPAAPLARRALATPDVYEAADHVPDLLELEPIGLEGFEGVMIEALRRKGAPNLDLMPEGGGYLLVEFGADNAADADAAAQQLVDRVKRSRYAPNTRVYTRAEAKAVWRIREAGPRAAISAPGAPPRYEGWDDSAVPPAHLGAYLRDLRALQNEYNYQAVYYGHFGHALHPHADELRSAERAWHPGVWRVRRAGGRSRGPLRRFDLGRARRWTVARRAAAEDVRPGADAGTARVQGDLGSRTTR